MPVNSWIENAAAHSGHEIEWTARTSGEDRVRLNEEEISGLIADTTPLLDRVHAGPSLETEDFTLVGKLTADAEEAKDDIQVILDMAGWWTNDGLIDAIDWFESLDWEGVAVTASSTNTELDAMVAP